MKKFLLLFIVLGCSSIAFSQQKFKRVRSSTDEFTGTTWYKPTYQFYLNPYIGENAGRIWMRLKIIYRGSSWIFFDKINIKIDDEIVAIDFSESLKKETILSSGSIEESVDLSVDDKLMSILVQLASSINSKISFSGEYRSDLSIHNFNIRAINDILNVYTFLNDHEDNRPKSNKSTSLNFEWGTSPNYVKSIETNNFMMGNEKMLVYNYQLYDNKCMLTYRFTNNKLDAVSIFFDTTDKDIKAMFFNIMNKVSIDYGEPIHMDKDKASWTTNEFRVFLGILDPDEKETLSLTFFPR